MPGDAVIRVTAAGICGSDLLDWYVARKAGTVLGHEIAGEIVEVGAGVSEFSPGDRVVPHHHAPCLECGFCLTGRFVHCSSGARRASTPAAWRSSSGSPREISRATRTGSPPAVSDEGASLTEPLATVVKALRPGTPSGGPDPFS